MEDALFQRFGMASSTYAWRTDTEERLVCGHNRGVVARGQRDFTARLLGYAGQQQKPLSAFTHDELRRRHAGASAVASAAAKFHPHQCCRQPAHDHPRLLRVPGAHPRAGRWGRRTERGHARTDAVTADPAESRPRLGARLGDRDDERPGSDIWHWGDNGTIKNFVLAHPPSRSAVVVFTNAAQGMRLAEALVREASSSEHLAFDWIG